MTVQLKSMLKENAQQNLVDNSKAQISETPKP